MNKAGKLAGEWGPGMLLTLGTLWVLQGALAYAPGHGVIVQGLNCDKGVVKSGAVVRYDVRVTNLSAHSVWLNAQPACGCTILDTLSKPIVSFCTADMKAQVDTFGLKKGHYLKPVLLQFKTNRVRWNRTIMIAFDVAN